jgi:hypothetical protein
LTILGLDLDRSNLGNARLLGLPGDVLGGDPTGMLFDWVNSAFFFTYVRTRTISTFLCTELLDFIDHLPNPRYSNFKVMSASLVDGGLCHWMGIIFFSHGKRLLFEFKKASSKFAQAATFNLPAIIVARLFLGIFESGFGPAIPLYFCELVVVKRIFVC